MKFKKIAALVLSAMMIASLVGCGSAKEEAAPAPEAVEEAPAVEPEEEAPASEPAEEAGEDSAEAEAPAEDGDIEMKVGVTMQGVSAPYIAGMADHIEKIAAEHPSWDVTVVDGNGDANTQISQVETFINSGCDIICMNPISFDGCAPAVEAANDAGIPIIIFQTTVSNGKDAVTTIGVNHYDTGVKEAQAMVEDLGGKGKIGIIEGVMGIDAQILRAQAYEDVLKDYPDIEVIAQSNADWDRADAMALVENWLSSGNEFDCILAQNDNMALGAIEALEAAGLLDKTLVYGIDGDADALLAIKDGKLNGTSFCDSAAIAQWTLDTCQRYLKGETIENEMDVTDVALIWIDETNVDEYIK
jgi:inositol transport system substrate-binding protein